MKEWFEELPEYRPHSSLQGMTPDEAETEYLRNPEFSTFELSEKWEQVKFNQNI